VNPAVAAIIERVRDAHASGRALRIRGGGTKDFYGERSLGDALEMSPYSGIVAYEPKELVLTVRAGTRLAEVEAALAAERQMLPFEPPHFPGGKATIGGTVAAGLSGPRRPYAGAVRDFVLGARIVNGKGEDLSFGGRVIKNVAGYDVSRLMAGALGTLGAITEVSFKVLPRPSAELTLSQQVDEAEIGDDVPRTQLARDGRIDRADEDPVGLLDEAVEIHRLEGRRACRRRPGEADPQKADGHPAHREPPRPLFTRRRVAPSTEFSGFRQPAMHFPLLDQSSLGRKASTDR
jgi:FAD/FMN-containing dehydrogenase